MIISEYRQWSIRSAVLFLYNFMISYGINVRSFFDKKKLAVYLTRFLSSKQFKSRYIKCSLSFRTTDINNVRVSDFHILDLKNSDEVKSFRFHMHSSYQNFLLKNNSSIRDVMFNYIEISRKQYLNHINELTSVHDIRFK